MNIETFLPLLATAVITLIGWYILHTLSKNQEDKKHRKNISLQALLEAWQKLEHAAYRQGNYDVVEHLQKPIASVQLYGTPKLVQMAQQVSNEYGEKGNAVLIELLVALRNHLRKELSLVQVRDEIKHFRTSSSNRRQTQQRPSSRPPRSSNAPPRRRPPQRRREPENKPSDR